MSTGCHGGSYWQARYSEAEQDLSKGDSDRTVKIAQEGYSALQKRNPVLAWKFRVLNARGLIRQHEPEQVVSLLANTPDHLPADLRAKANLTRSLSLCDLHRNAEADRVVDQSEALAAGSRDLQSRMLYTRAECMLGQDRSRAESYLERAANLAHGVDADLEALALLERGYWLMQDGRYDQAIDEFNRALVATDSQYLQMVALGNLGYSHRSLGDWQAAPGYLEKAEKLASTMSDAKASRALWLIDLGQNYFSQLEYSKAGEAWSKALAMARNQNDPWLKVTSLNNLAVLALNTGERGAAERYIEEGKQLNAPEEQKLYLILTEAKLAKLNGNLRMAEDLMLQILASHPDTITRYNTQTELATLYSEQGRNTEAEKMFLQAISTAEGAFALVESEQFRISFMDQEPFYDGYIHFLIGQNRLVDALSIAERGRSRALATALKLNPGKNLKLASVQTALRARNQIALAYWLSPKESYLWVITPSQMKLLKLPPEMEMVKAIDSYGQEVLDLSAPEDSQLGQKLYAMLVAPAEKYIHRGAKVVIVPHRRLYKLNFETLVSPRPKPHFWIEDVCVQYSSFLETLEKTNTAQPQYSKDMLLMGAPVQASKEFPGLAHAAQEIEKVAAHFPPSQETVIEGAEATPPAYKRSDPSEYRFFHFVTHGTASDGNPLDSAIILSPSNKGYKLYARDIIETRIHPQLVTISACYGAGTRQYSGEGLVGLAWAFLRVGAHQVVAALWEVDDAATADLMDQFYSELTRGKTVAQALRDSKLAMLHSQGPRRRPYYWASLQLYTGR